MPRVSQEHLDARRRQILEAARTCFIRNGFHATTMQDVFAEAGLSAGAVYRYFSGKTELIGAIAREKVSDVTAPLDNLPEDLPPLDEMLGRLVTNVVAANERDQIALLLSQVWAEAIRSPEVAETVRNNIGIVFERLTRLAKLYQERGELSADVPPEKIARALAALVQGFMLQITVIQDIDVDEFRVGIRGLLASYDRSDG